MEWNEESWSEIWDVWNVEARVFVFLSVRRNVGGDVEGERIWIWSDVCVVWTVGE